MDAPAGAMTLPCCHVVACAKCVEPPPALCYVCRGRIHYSAAIKDPAVAKICGANSAGLAKLAKLLRAPITSAGAGMSNSDTFDAIIEFVKFLRLKAAAEDYDGTKLSPSDAMDEIWHCAMLLPVAYSALCGTIAPGRLFDHVVPAEESGRDARRAATWAAYTEAFGSPQGPYWRDLEPAFIGIVLKTLAGDSYPCPPLLPTMTIRSV